MKKGSGSTLGSQMFTHFTDSQIFHILHIVVDLYLRNNSTDFDAMTLACGLHL